MAGNERSCFCLSLHAGLDCWVDLGRITDNVDRASLASFTLSLKGWLAARDICGACICLSNDYFPELCNGMVAVSLIAVSSFVSLRGERAV